MARERYLLDGDEEKIHQPEAELKAISAKSKWENFWYYHKLHVLIGIVVVFAAAFFIHDFTSKVNPDYQIGLITQTAYPSEMAQTLENEFAKYGSDLNGDGKVVVQVNSYTIAGSSSSGNTDPNVQMAGFVKLTADLSEGSSMIYITDDESFQNQQSKGQIFAYLDGSLPAEGAKDYQKMRISLKDCKKLASLKIPFASGDNGDTIANLSMSMRVFKGTQMEGQKAKASYFAACKKLFDKVVYDK